jgi:predicted GNAT family N-acyltransferase
MDSPPAGPVRAITISLQEGTGGPLWPGVIALRERVFGDEQGIVEASGADTDDEQSIHAVAWEQDDSGLPVVVGAGRITLNNQGRDEAIVAWVATDRSRRRQGIGREVMYALLDEADRAGMRETVLAAQRHAEAFYSGLGFHPSGAPYKMRGIPHRWMIRSRPR